MGYRRATVYFASGTGNSYRAAAWLYEACIAKNIESELIPVDAARPKEEIEASRRQLVALAFPTHGFLPPWSVIKFLLKMPLKRGARFFCVPTRGSFRIGKKVIIPGAAGLANFLPALLLLFKGFLARGALSLDMPVNITSIHPPLTEKGARIVIGQAKQLADEQYERVLSGGSLWLTWNNFYELCWAAPLMLFFPLFPLLYLMIGRFFMGHLHFANSNCRGCGACAKSCPNQAIKMTGKKKKRPYWRYNCEACLRCLNSCPQKAIEAGQSWAVLLWFIMSFPLSAFLYQLVRDYLPIVAGIENWWLRELVFCVYYYPAIILAYWLFSKLLRLKPFNLLFTYTTFTRLWKRYREPDTRRQHLLRGSRVDDQDGMC